MRMTVTTARLLFATAAVVAYSSAWSGMRQDVYAALNQVEGNWPDAVLAVAANDSESLASVQVGETIRYTARSAARGHFTMMHVDSHGAATLIVPECGGRTEQCSYPETGGLPVQPPLGKETLYVFMTDEPVPAAELGMEDGKSYFQLPDAVELAKGVSSLIMRMADQGKVAVTKIDYMVEGAAGTTQYTTRAIIRQFEDGLETKPSPVAARKALSANMIHFEFGSAELTTQGTINLDVFGEAFLSGALAGQAYILAGHTDDVGEERYNEWLSMERARSAKAYLVEHFGIGPERIQVKGFGSANPLTTNRDDESRAMNRRVEFVRIK